MTGPTALAAPGLLDEVLPRYEAREVHQIFVAAPRTEVYRALEVLTLGEVSLFRVLMGARPPDPAGQVPEASHRRRSAGLARPGHAAARLGPAMVHRARSAPRI